MRDIGPIITTSIRNNLRSKALTISFLGLALMLVVGAVLIFCLLFVAPALEAELPDRSELELYLGLIMFITCLFGVGININVFTFLPLTREKSRGVIESLLATPLEAKDVWLGKSLALFLPGLVLGEVFTLIALIAINYIYFVPKVGFLITPWIAISSFVAVPLIFICLSLLVHLIGLTGRPATGNVVAQIFLPVIAALMINLGSHRILDITSWPFTLTNLGIAVAVGVVVILLQPRLTKERIVLSRQE